MRIRGRIVQVVARVVARVVAIVVARVVVGAMIVWTVSLVVYHADIIHIIISTLLQRTHIIGIHIPNGGVIEAIVVATLTPALATVVAPPAPPTTIVLAVEQQIAVETETLENTNVTDNVQPLARHKDQDGTVFVNHNQINVVKRTLEEKQNVLDQG